MHQAGHDAKLEGRVNALELWLTVEALEDCLYHDVMGEPTRTQLEETLVRVKVAAERAMAREFRSDEFKFFPELFA